MLAIPSDLHKQLLDHGQKHVLAWWDHLNDAERRQLLDQLRDINLAELRQLYHQRDNVFSLPLPDHIAPIPVVRLSEKLDPGQPDAREARRLGEEALRRGEVAVLVVAGGQGSRLGFEHPKGMFPIGPVSDKTPVPDPRRKGAGPAPAATASPCRCSS